MWSESFQEYISNLIEAVDFYEGRQWRPEDITTLQDAGLKPVTVNHIGQRLDALAGKEAATRTRFKYKSRSGNPTEVKQAEAISGLGLFVQEKNRTSRRLSEAKHHARIGGLGWHCFDVHDNQIFESTESPFDMVHDTRDHTPLLTNQGFSARIRWMPMDEAKQRFPDKADELEKYGNAGGGLGEPAYSFVTARVSGQPSGCDAYKFYSVGSYWNEKDREVAIVEFQFREPAKYYVAPTKDNLVITTFDKAEAEKAATSKKLIQTVDGYKVKFCYFTGSLDLELFDSPYQIDPQRGLFLNTPFVYARSMRDGAPYGLVGKAVDPQRLYNLKQAKINWLMAARQVIYDKGAVDDTAQLAAEVNKPNSLIVKNPNKELKIDTHGQEIAQHYQSLAIHKGEIEAALGIYDEMLGIETNAQSGIAIQKRQSASLSTQIFSSDGFSEGQRQVAEKLLGLMRSVLTQTVVNNVLDDDSAYQELRFSTDGKGVDLRQGQYDVVIEQVPDVDTMNDIARDGLIQLIQFGVPLERLTPGWLDLFQVPKSSTLRQEIEQGIQQKLSQLEQMQAQQQKIGNGAQPVPIGGGANPAAQPQIMNG